MQRLGYISGSRQFMPIKKARFRQNFIFFFIYAQTLIIFRTHNISCVLDCPFCRHTCHSHLILAQSSKIIWADILIFKFLAQLLGTAFTRAQFVHNLWAQCTTSGRIPQHCPISAQSCLHSAHPTATT